MASNQVDEYIQSRFTSQWIEQKGWQHGYNWLSIGGEHATRNFLSQLVLSPGERVLDVGCGTGGSAFYLARYYGVYVHGVDLATDMIQGARQQHHKLEENIQQRVTFETGDIMRVKLEEESYDMIFSRDVLVYIEDKDNLFQKLYRLLKPNGTIFFSDYCATPQTTTELLADVRNKRCFYMKTVADQARMLRTAGFEDLKAEDLQQEFRELHLNVRRSFSSKREAFVATYSQSCFDKLNQEWTNQISWVDEGQLTWGAFTAQKKSK